MSTDKIVFPFAHLDSLTLRISSLIDADANVPLANVVHPEDFGTQHFDLTEATPAWQVLAVKLELELEPDVVRSVTSKLTDLGQQVIPMVSASCSGTKFRKGFPLKVGKGNKWSREIILRRTDLRGKLTLKPILVRRQEGSKKPGLAAFAGAILGEGPELELTLDDSAGGPAGQFAYKWEFFAKSDNSWVASRPDDVVFVEAGKVPLLRLNLRWPSVQPVLINKAFVGMTAALTNTFGALIAYGTFFQLLTTAVGSIRIDDEDEVSVEGEPWRSDLAHFAASALLPEEEQKEALKLLEVQFKDPAELAMLLSKLGSLANEMSKMGRLLEKAAASVGTATEDGAVNANE